MCVWGFLLCVFVTLLRVRVHARERLCESVLPCVVLLKAFQLIPLLRQRGLQVEIGSIVGQLQSAVIELETRQRRAVKRYSSPQSPYQYYGCIFGPWSCNMSY